MLDTWELTGADELAAAWDKAPQIAREELTRFMEGATTHLEGEIKERTPGAHGTLKASFTGSVEQLSDGVLGVVGSPLNYAIPVELGTRPHFPPVDAIQDWVQVKLGITGPEARGVAFAIARKIAKRGTQGAFMVQNAFTASRAELDRQARLMLDALRTRLSSGGT
jgi:hypothetical protein